MHHEWNMNFFLLLGSTVLLGKSDCNCLVWVFPIWVLKIIKRVECGCLQAECQNFEVVIVCGRLLLYYYSRFLWFLFVLAELIIVVGNIQICNLSHCPSIRWIYWESEGWFFLWMVTYVKLSSICNFPGISVLCFLISYFVHCYGLTKRR